jgi:hypothetical protein
MKKVIGTQSLDSIFAAIDGVVLNTRVEEPPADAICARDYSQRKGCAESTARGILAGMALKGYFEVVPVKRGSTITKYYRLKP